MNLGEGLLADKPEDETLILCLRARQLYRLISCDATQVVQDTMKLCVCVCLCVFVVNPVCLHGVPQAVIQPCAQMALGSM